MYIYIYIYIYICVYKHMCVHVSSVQVYIYICVYMFHLYGCTYIFYSHLNRCDVNMCLCVHVFVCTHTTYTQRHNTITHKHI